MWELNVFGNRRFEIWTCREIENLDVLILNCVMELKVIDPLPFLLFLSLPSSCPRVVPTTANKSL